MQQRHTELTINHTDDQQNTGNHRKGGSGGVDEVSGTRAGAENVEPPQHEKAASDKAGSVETGTDGNRMPSLDGTSPAPSP